MTCRLRLPFALLVAAFLSPGLSSAAEELGPFFEADQPFFQTQVEVVPPAQDAPNGSGNFVVRGIILPLPSGHCAVFDQELMRFAGFWVVPAGQPPITPVTMAQISYVVPKRKVSSEHPQPTGPLILKSEMHPGVAAEIPALFQDPRVLPREGDQGRGALPVELARFTGIELAGGTAILSYQGRGTAIREWLDSRAMAGVTQILRHLEVAPHAQPLHFTVGNVGSTPWTISGAQLASADTSGVGRLRVATNSAAFTLSEHQGELIATLAPARETQRVTIALSFGTSDPSATPNERQLPATPAAPTAAKPRRWPEKASAPVQLDSIKQNGLVLDRIAVPEENPWKRRVRAADLAFLTEDRAAVVTYDGDVWLVDGFGDPQASVLSWQRFATGLHEPLAIAAPKGVIQVATKNGIVRLYDRDANGEADWFENFNDQMIQSQTTRSFPLDMAVAPDGSAYVTQGGITTPSGLVSGGTGTSHAGGILKISPDGRSAELFARSGREPFLTVHPVTGIVTATDQQGHWIPSSVCYFVRKGDSYGFLEDNPTHLTPPLVWIPHDQDSSSSSQVWMIGERMGAWNGRLLHLSYGTGRLFLITPDLDAPVPQGAVIPLDLKTDLPLLHARMHPRGDAVLLAGFQIWGTRTTTRWALGRLRPGTTPIVIPLAARSVEEGVILDFAEPLDPASLKPELVSVRVWNYKRSSAYGSGRYNPDGTSGTTAWGVGQVVLSTDKKSVFVHLPKLPPVMQLEVRHDFRFATGTEVRGVAYLTIHQPHSVDLAQAGFPHVDLSKSVAVITREKEQPATAAMGKTLAESLGCLACHSIDGTTEGKIGPTWKGLFGSTRKFIDGTTEIADELYLREKILDPLKRRVTVTQAEMPSYRGVVSEQQLESLVLYIRSLRAGAAPRAD